MSVTFHIEGRPPDYDDESTYLNLGNVNAGDILEWLALPRVLWGEVAAPLQPLAASADMLHSRRTLTHANWREIEGASLELPGRSGPETEDDLPGF